MADAKISALPASTTPLAGTEVLPIVQGSQTRQVSINNLTAGKDVSALSVTATNLKTSPTAANLDVSGTSLTAAGTDANININLVAKGTGQVVINAGAVGTPTISPTGDLNTGIFFPAADTIAFAEGGAEAMRLDSSGNVLIGTTNSTIGKSVVNGIQTIANVTNLAFNNTIVNYNSTVVPATLTTVATLTPPVNLRMAKILMTVTATNNDGNYGYSVACSIREILISTYGGNLNIINSSELSNNQGSVNAAVINVTLTTAASVSGSTILLSATPSVTGVVGSNNLDLATKVEILSSNEYIPVTTP